MTTASVSAAPVPAVASERFGKLRTLLAWAASLLLPPLLLLLPDASGLDDRMRLFLVITSWAIIVWGFNLISEVAVAMILPVLYVAAGLLPYKEAMSS